MATLTSLIGRAFRPAQRALVPSLANGPGELTASNGTSSTLESLAFFVGPAIGALLLGVADVAVVFLLNAATFVWSAAFVLGVRVPGTPVPSRTAEPADDEPKASFLRETLAGFHTILRDRDLLVVTVQVSAQTVVAGATAVFTILIAVDILGTGPRGVGYLDSVLGVGAILGGFVAIARATRFRLAQDMNIGVDALGAPAGAGEHLAAPGGGLRWRWPCSASATRWWTSTWTRSSSGSPPTRCSAACSAPWRRASSRRWRSVRR